MREGAYQEEVIVDLAARVASRYARRVFWASIEDLRQEAAVTVLECRRTWSPKVGVPFPAYAWSACLKHLQRYLWRESSPVHASDKAAAEMAGVHRAELKESLIEDAPLADELYEQRAWHAAAVDQLMFVMLSRESIEEAAVAIRVLLDEELPAVVAADAGLPIARVYGILKNTRRHIADNEALYDLWRNR